MSLGYFPKVIYKKTNVGGYFSIEEGNEKYEFQVGDTLIVAIKKNFDDDRYIISKTIVVNKAETSVLISFSAEETADLPKDEHAIFEIKLISSDGQIKEPVYQEKIYLGGVVIDE